MPSSKTRIKPIRIANETEEYFDGKPLNRMVESLHRLLESGRVRFDGEELKVGCKYEIDEAVLDDLALMAPFAGGTVGGMIRLFDESVNEGNLGFDGKRFVVPEWEDFVEMCKKKGLDYTNVMEKVKEMIERGEI